MPPNPRMQPTGRSGPAAPLGRRAPVSALWNVGLCGRRLEGLQLMRKSLGRSRASGQGASQLKCERCGEREAEVLHTNLVRTAERDDARTQHLCRNCANVDPNAMQAGVDRFSSPKRI